MTTNIRSSLDVQYLLCKNERYKSQAISQRCVLGMIFPENLSPNSAFGDVFCLWRCFFNPTWILYASVGMLCSTCRFRCLYRDICLGGDTTTRDRGARKRHNSSPREFHVTWWLSRCWYKRNLPPWQKIAFSLMGSSMNRDILAYDDLYEQRLFGRQDDSLPVTDVLFLL